MLTKEKNYDFRARLLDIYKKNVVDKTLTPKEDEYVLKDGAVITYTGNDTVAQSGIAYFTKYAETGLCYTIKTGKNGAVRVTIDPTFRGYKAFRLTVTENGVDVLAHDGRGVLQAFFRLEERIKLRRAPFLTYGTEEREPLFSPRMVHSGYQGCVYPEEYLIAIARAGMDAVILPIGMSSVDENDYASVFALCEKWGLDVYAYSHIWGKYNPKDPKADEYYENTYGASLEKYPYKGVILVGESVGFPSEDTDASPVGVVDYVPVQKPLTGFWPCKDYPEYVAYLRDIVHRHRPETEIVFWTYNWGEAPTEKRLRLIENLPTDVCLLVTFEMYKKYPLPNSKLVQLATDYTIGCIGPSETFTSEAEAAHRRGIKLYSMTNTSGSTWDMGGIPYMPVPFQWIKRFNAVKQARKDYGLCGLMECHFYGFTPSFINELTKVAFETSDDLEAALDDILTLHYGKENLATVRKTLQKWSDGAAHIPPDAEDQYSAFRVGPSYPFNFTEEFRYPAESPSAGNYSFDYYPTQNEGWHSVSSERIPYEIAELEEAHRLFEEGLALLKTVENPNTELEYLTNMGEMMCCYFVTGIHNKQWHILRLTLLACTDHERIRTLCDECEALLTDEKANALRAVPCAENDSRLGWDADMLYRTDPVRILWKIRYIDFVINVKLGNIRKELDL